MKNSSVPLCPAWLRCLSLFVITSPKFTREIVQLPCFSASLCSIITAAAETAKPGSGDHQRGPWGNTEPPPRRDVLSAEQPCGLMDGFAFLRAEQIWRGAACSVLLQRCRGKRAAARWLRRGEQYFTGEKLWVDVVTGSPAAGGCLLNRFALTTSVCRVLFFSFFQGLSFLRALILMCFRWMAI